MLLYDEAGLQIFKEVKDALHRAVHFFNLAIAEVEADNVFAFLLSHGCRE